MCVRECVNLFQFLHLLKLVFGRAFGLRSLPKYLMHITEIISAECFGLEIYLNLLEINFVNEATSRETCRQSEMIETLYIPNILGHLFTTPSTKPFNGAL